MRLIMESTAQNKELTLSDIAQLITTTRTDLEAKIISSADETKRGLEAKIISSADETKRGLEAKIISSADETKRGLEAKIDETKKFLEAKIETSVHELATMNQNQFLELGKKINNVENGVEEIKLDIRKLKTDTKEVEANINKKVDKVDHNTLTYRVEKLEKHFAQ